MKEALGGRTLLALINNAGIAWPAALSMQPLEDFSNIVNTNLVGYVCVTQVEWSLPRAKTCRAAQGGRNL